MAFEKLEILISKKKEEETFGRFRQIDIRQHTAQRAQHVFIDCSLLCLVPMGGKKTGWNSGIFFFPVD
jgi:hypothetical protein